MHDRFSELLAQYDRIAVAGGPRTGKTTLCDAVGDRLVVHTDDWKPPKRGRPDTAGKYWRPGMTYDTIPDHIARACHAGRLVIEGVRALGVVKAGVQVDCVVWLGNPLVTLTPEQETQRKGRETNFRNWLSDYRPHELPVVILS